MFLTSFTVKMSDGNGPVRGRSRSKRANTRWLRTASSLALAPKATAPSAIIAETNDPCLSASTVLISILLPENWRVVEDAPAGIGAGQSHGDHQFLIPVSPRNAMNRLGFAGRVLRIH